MPSRMLRDKLVTSETVASLPPDVQDRLHRYFLAADDYGCFRVQPAVIRGQVWPLRPEMTDQRVLDDLVAYASIDTIAFYEVDGKKYAHFVNWLEHNRKPRPDAKRKTPPPPARKAQPPNPATSVRSGPAADPQKVDADPRADLPAVQSQFSRSSVAGAGDPQKPAADPQKPDERPAAATQAWDQELLEDLRKAFRVNEFTDAEFAGFLDSSLKIAKPQREEAARAFLERGCAKDGKGYGYLLRMMHGGATRRTPEVRSDPGNNAIPDVAETEAMLQSLRRPKNTPPHLRGKQ